MRSRLLAWGCNMEDTESTRYKKCSKCGALLPLSSFYKQKSMADGHSNKCKECTKQDVKDNRKKNIERYREYDRERNQSEDRKALRRRYCQSDEGKEAHKRACDKWVKNNEKKRHAEIMVGNAIRDGKLIKQPCEVCGREDRVHAHHCDYDKPLDVMWLCPICHRAWHNEHGEGANAHDEVLSGERIS